MGIEKRGGKKEYISQRQRRRGKGGEKKSWLALKNEVPVAVGGRGRA